MGVDCVLLHKLYEDNSIFPMSYQQEKEDRDCGGCVNVQVQNDEQSDYLLGLDLSVSLTLEHLCDCSGCVHKFICIVCTYISLYM